MKKILLTIFLSLAFCNTGFTESYYFKKCKLSENASGDYLLDDYLYNDYKRKYRNSK